MKTAMVENALRRFVAQELKGTIAALYVYGSAVELFCRSGQLSPGQEVDLMFVFDGKHDWAELPVPESTFAKVSTYLPQSISHEIIFNGCLPLHKRADVIYFDVLWDCTASIDSQFAYSIVVAKKPKRLLLGDDLYGGLAAKELTAEQLLFMARSMAEYLRHRLITPSQEYQRKAIAKGALFIVSMLDASTICTNDPDAIVEIVSKKHPQLADVVLLFRETLMGTGSIGRDPHVALEELMELVEDIAK